MVNKPGLLDILNRHRRTVFIEPYTAPGPNNAAAQPFSEAASGTFSSKRTAAGTHSIVLFSVNRSTFPRSWPQGRADEVMVHELAHALRQVTGTERKAREPAGEDGLLDMASFDNVEEFFAAMVASVHSSELGRPALGNHGQWPLRNPQLLDRPPYTTRMREIRSRMPDFCRQIAAINTGFNPFRDLV